VLREVASLARGRHLALWSADPEEQAVLEDLGVAGSADPEGDDLALVAVNNLGANKLDYYVDREVEVVVTVGRDRAEVVQRVLLSNRAPEDLVPYVAGVDEPGHRRGAGRAVVAQSGAVPLAAQGRRDDHGEVRRGAERTRVHTYVELARGESVQLELRYVVPITTGSTGCGCSPSRWPGMRSCGSASTRLPGCRSPPPVRSAQAGPIRREGRGRRRSCWPSSLPRPSGSRRRSVRALAAETAKAVFQRMTRSRPATSSRRSAGRAAPTPPRTGRSGR
jgi:hypothetical protein